MLKRISLAVVGIATIVAVSFASAQRTTTFGTLTAPELRDIRGGACYRPLTDADKTNDCTGTRQFTIECKDHGCTRVAPLQYECKKAIGAGSWNGAVDYHNACPHAAEDEDGHMTCGYANTYCETFYQCGNCVVPQGTSTYVCKTGSAHNDGNAIQKVTVHGTACVGVAPPPSAPMPEDDPFEGF